MEFKVFGRRYLWRPPLWMKAIGVILSALLFLAGTFGTFAILYIL